jgi:putative hemolysin
MAALEIIVVAVLILLNGYLAMCELAVVSSRRSHLERLAASGHVGARGALILANDPARFLAVLQIGITTVAVLTGTFSGAAGLVPQRLGRPRAAHLRRARGI